jgi:hypothetical protein
MAINRRVAGGAAVVFAAVASLIAGAIGAPPAGNVPSTPTPGAVPPDASARKEAPQSEQVQKGSVPRATDPGAQPPAWGESKPDAKTQAPSATRGKEALLSRNFIPPVIARSDYENLWKAWGLKSKPADFAQQVLDRYGLHAAPYDNGGLPMGLRPAQSKRGPAVSIDCMLCHGGSIFGTSYVGLPNTTIELDGLFRDMAEVEPGPDFLPYRFSNVRGTTEATAAAHFLIKFRDADLNFRFPVADLGPTPDRLCEDAPAWWLL